ncbi:myeloid zinc finger 1-like isoform X2 [Pseudophryne corroboree]
MMEDITLTFSDEEWLGLAAWQRELYRTVMKDTTELFTSLGFMFLTQESAGESTVTHPAVSEETAGEKFIIQMTEASVFQEDTGKHAMTAEAPESHLCQGDHFTPPHPEAPSFQETLFPQHAQRSVVPENLQENLIQTSTGQEGPGGRSIAWHTEAGSDELLPTRNPGDICNVRDGAGSSGDTGDSRLDLVIGSDETFPDSDYLTIIQVEEINVALEKEVKTTHRDGWDVYPDDSIVPWKNEETLRGEAAFPLTLLGPQNRTNDQYPWTENNGILAPDTDRWSDQIQLGNCLNAAEGGARATPVGSQVSQSVELDETNPQEYRLGESLYKCSICCQSFCHKLHLERHVRGHMEERTFTCPTCYRHFISKHYLQEHERTHHTSLPGDSRRTDQAKRTPQNFLCTQCNRRFSQLVGLHRHQKVHTRRNKNLPGTVAPPTRKVYKLPLLQPSVTRKTEPKADSSGEAFTKLHQHLQVSTAFLQNLITSTCGFQYD